MAPRAVKSHAYGFNPVFVNMVHRLTEGKKVVMAKVL